jgi:peptidoglycan/xylan/chitin deacetylase (PgdA/CDA1 family)
MAAAATWLRRGGFALIALGVAAGGLSLAGYLLPGTVDAAVDVTLPVPSERLFPLLVSVDGVNTWWTTPLPDGSPSGLVVLGKKFGPDVGVGTVLTFRAPGSDFDLETWQITDARAGRRVEYDVDFGIFVVHRTIDLTPVPEGTLVRWSEHGFVENPVVRWLVWAEGTQGAEANFRMALQQLATAAGGRSAPIDVALTFDDLPYQTAQGRPTAPQAEWSDVSASILAHLREASVPAAVFVNGDAAEDAPALVAKWTGAGHTVGNHTARHVSVDRVSPDEWAADVRRSHETLVRQSGGPIAWFRYPYLRQGADQATADAAAAVLAGLGERNAPVTVATTEWYLAQRYDAATTDDAREELTRAFVDTTREDLLAAVRLAKVHRPEPVPHVLLLHVNHLEADHLDELLVALAAEGVRFVTLEAAMADPIYGEPTRPQPGGSSWLVRLHPDGPDPFAVREAALAKRFPTP